MAAGRQSGPRIRSLKPEIWNSEDLCRLTVDGALIFIALITLADDHGRVKTNPSHLNLAAFHGQEPTVEVIQDAFDQMEAQQMIQTYQVDGSGYLWLVNFNKHQKIDHPSPPRHPAPPDLGDSSLIISNYPDNSSGIRSDQIRPDQISTNKNPSPLPDQGLAEEAENDPSEPTDPDVFRWLVEQGKSDADKETVERFCLETTCDMGGHPAHVIAALEQARDQGKLNGHSGKASLAYIQTNTNGMGLGSLLGRCCEDFANGDFKPVVEDEA